MKENEIEALVRPNVRAMKPYSTARDEYVGTLGVFMDANECPYDTGYNRYPDPHQSELKAKVASLKGVNVENVFIGNGSDEAVDVILRVFCRPGIDNVVSIAPTYGMYSVVAATNDVEFREVTLDRFFALNVPDLLESCDENTKVMFICSPNNPSGNAFPLEQMFALLQSFKGILVVDEAYIDFSSVPSLLGEIGRYPNLVILQTLSKARGMASLRIGFAFSSPYVISMMAKVKYPYNICGPAQKLALEALETPIEERVATIIDQRRKVIDVLVKFRCVRRAFNSDANFVLVKVDAPDALYDHFLSRGIIVRNRNRVVNCQGCLRITIGTPEENAKMLEALEEYEEGYFCG